MAVIEIKPDPSIWVWQNDNSDPSDNNPGVWSTYMDLDGTTAWLFEGFAGGWARVNLTDGSFLAQDTAFGQADRGNDDRPFWFWNWQGVYSTFFTQDPDDHSTYFCSIQGLTLTGFSSGTYLYKFNVGSGIEAGLLNGYSNNETYFSIYGGEWYTMLESSFWPNDIRLVKVGGTNYIVMTGSPDGGFGIVMIVNADTMTWVGNFKAGLDHFTFPFHWQCFSSFVDPSGVFWFTYVNTSTNDVALVPWTPSDGATGGWLNIGTIQNISAATHGLVTSGSAWMSVAGYIPETNSLLLADSDVPPTSQGCANVALISMTTFTRTSFLANDNTFFHTAGAFCYPSTPVAVDSMDRVYLSTAAFALEGSTNTADQVGGVINLVNPATLTATATNVTSLINASTVPDPIGLTTVVTYAGGANGSPPQYRPFTGMAWNPTASKAIVSYGDINRGFGSAAYIVPLPGVHPPPPPPNYNAVFSLQKLILSLKPDTIPDRGRN